MRKIKFIGGILFLYVGALLFIEAIGQLTIRYLESKTTSGVFGEELLNHSEPVLGFGLKKNLNVRYGHWSVETNNLGFRAPEFPEAKPNNEYRVFVVGGSTVFGWGSTPDATIPFFIEKLVREKLAKSGRKNLKQVRVINAGVPWYASWHEMALIFHRLLPLDPDWIIVLDGLNDVAAGVLPNWTPIHRGYLDLPTRIAAQRRQKAKEESLVLSLMNLSPTFRYFYARLKEKRGTAEGIPHPELWEQYTRYMTWMHKLTHSLDIRFSVFLQPVMVVDRKPLPVEVANDSSSLKVPSFAKAFRELYLVGERRLVSNASFPFKSLKSTFKDAKYRAYYDGLHYTGTGHYFIAKAIVDASVTGSEAQFLSAPQSSLP